MSSPGGPGISLDHIMVEKDCECKFGVQFNDFRGISSDYWASDSGMAVMTVIAFAVIYF